MVPSVDPLPAVSTLTFAMPSRRGSRLRTTCTFCTRSMGIERCCVLNTPLRMTISLSVIQ